MLALTGWVEIEINNTETVSHLSKDTRKPFELEIPRTACGSRTKLIVRAPTTVYYPWLFAIWNLSLTIYQE